MFCGRGMKGWRTLGSAIEATDSAMKLTGKSGYPALPVLSLAAPFNSTFPHWQSSDAHSYCIGLSLIIELFGQFWIDVAGLTYGFPYYICGKQSVIAN